jgi:hypothetical protein
MPKLMAGAALCGSLIMLLFVPAGVAGQPVTQALNPPPPAFLTCKAVGSGTLCSGTRSFAYSELLNDEGGPAFTCGSGANAFVIVDSGIHSQNVIRTYDANGNLVKRVVHDAFDSTFSNSVSGAAVPYHQHDTLTDVFAVPADFDTITETMTGLLTNVVLPHEGTVWLQAGRTVTDAAGLEFEAGPDAGNDWQFDGDVSVWQPVCAALR